MIDIQASEGYGGFDGALSAFMHSLSMLTNGTKRFGYLKTSLRMSSCSKPRTFAVSP
jgi:hypothetical protein